jgi:hypothetical protein
MINGRQTKETVSKKNGLSVNSVQEYLIYHRFTTSVNITEKMKNFIINGAKGLGDFPVNPHFIPNYHGTTFCIAQW